jgi:hypothetical protein
MKGSSDHAPLVNPFLIYLVFLLIGMLLERVLPLSPAPRHIAWVVGAIVTLLSLLIGGLFRGDRIPDPGEMRHPGLAYPSGRPGREGDGGEG